jgi:hypothetical protein
MVPAHDGLVTERWLSPLDTIPTGRGDADRVAPPEQLPAPARLIRRAHRHPRLMHYNRLIAVVLTANAALAVGAVAAGWWDGGATELEAIGAVAQANLVLAVLPRQPYVVNLVGWAATRPSATWPLRIRWALGKYYHLGGLHVGAALAGTLWYGAFVASMVADRWRGAPAVGTANVVLAATVVALFGGMVVMALPGLRSRLHDHFEVTHRFGAWTALALVWANTVLFARARHPGTPTVAAVLETPTAWLLAVTTGFALWPWLLLRRVPITVEQPSDHAAIVHLDHDIVTEVGTTRAISRHPLVGWHHFAVVPPAAERSGYRMVVSRAGDWTGAFVDDPPGHVWVRGLPAVGVANVRRLFDRVVFVVTGSGIGPGLSHLLADEMPTKLVWITREPRRTYGDAFVDEVLAAQPDALIWNTDERGKPDVLVLAYEALLETGAEAVICISNKAVTWRVVHGLEQRGIPAFGPIWDS